MKRGWKIKKIKDICDKASSNIAQNKITDIHGDYPVYGASGFVQNINFYHRDTPYIGIIKDGSGVGRVNVYPAYSSLLGTLQYILPKDGYLLNYVAYALNSINLPSFATGAAIPHIYFKNYGETEIRVAPLIEQEKIVAELDCLSSIIEKKKQQLKELDNLAQSIFYEMFGDPIENEKGWETNSLKNICTRLFAGGDVPKNNFSKVKTREYSVPIISNGVGENALYGYTCTAKVIEPCVTIAGRGTIGYCEARVVPFFPVVRVIVAVPNLNIIQPIVLKNIIDAYKFKGTGGAIQQLTIPMIKDCLIIQPPLCLQQEFASKIEAIEKQKELIRQSIQETETLFNSRMDYYFN